VSSRVRNPFLGDEDADDAHGDLFGQLGPLLHREILGLELAFAPHDEPLALAQSLAMAPVDFAYRHPADEVGVLRAHLNGADEVTGRAVVEDDLVWGQGGPGRVEQAHFVLVIVAPDRVQHGAAAQGADHHELHEGKTAAGPLKFWLGIPLLVFLRVGQSERGAVDDFDGATLQEGGRTDQPVGSARGVGQRGLEQIQRQPGAGLAVAAVAPVERRTALQDQQRLQLAHGLPAGGVVIEHLPDKTPEGAVQGVGPLALGARRLELRGRHEAADGRFDLAQGALPQERERARHAPAEGSEPGAEGGKKRSVRHRAVYIPLP